VIGFNSPQPLSDKVFCKENPESLLRLKPIYRMKFMAVAVLVFKTAIAHKPQQCFSAVTYPKLAVG